MGKNNKVKEYRVVAVRYVDRADSTTERILDNMFNVTQEVVEIYAEFLGAMKDLLWWFSKAVYAKIVFLLSRDKGTGRAASPPP